MPTIDLRRDHALGLHGARAAAQRVADDLQRDFGMACEWHGDVLRFSRTGVHGELTVADDHVRLHARLGMLLAAFSDRIEARVRRGFDRYFG